MSLSTHVLDTSLGTPAAGVPVVAERAEGDGWVRIGADVTDEDGRVADLVPGVLGTGPHRVTFDTGSYFARGGREAFWADIVITFTVTAPEQHHHVPLLLSPHGYTTYRGS